MIKYIWNI